MTLAAGFMVTPVAFGAPTSLHVFNSVITLFLRVHVARGSLVPTPPLRTPDVRNAYKLVCTCVLYVKCFGNKLAWAALTLQYNHL